MGQENYQTLQRVESAISIHSTKLTEFKFSELKQEQKYVVYALLLSNFATFMFGAAISVTITIYDPLYHSDLTSVHSGFIISAAKIGAALIAFPARPIANYFGYKKTAIFCLVSIATLILSVAFVMFADRVGITTVQDFLSQLIDHSDINDSVFFAMMFLLILLKGCFQGIFNVVGLTVISIELNPYSLIAMVFFVGSALISTMVSSLFTAFIIERTYFDVIYFTYSGLIYIAAIFASLVIPDKYNNMVEVLNERLPIDRTGHELSKKVTAKNILWNQSSLMGFYSLFVGFYGFGFIGPYLYKELISRRYSLMATGSVVALAAFCCGVGAFIGRRLVEKFQPKVITAIFLTLEGFTISLLGPSDWFGYPDDGWLIILGITFQGIFAGFLIVSGQAEILQGSKSSYLKSFGHEIENSPADCSAAFFQLVAVTVTFVECSSLAIAPEISGALDENYGYRKLCDITMVMVLGLALIYILIHFVFCREPQQTTELLPVKKAAEGENESDQLLSEREGVQAI